MKVNVHLDTVNLLGKTAYEIYQNCLRLQLTCDQANTTENTPLGHNVRSFEVYDFFNEIESAIFRAEQRVRMNDSDLKDNLESALRMLITDDDNEIEDFLARPAAAFNKYLGFAKNNKQIEYTKLYMINDLVPIAVQASGLCKAIAPIIWKVFEGIELGPKENQFIGHFGDGLLLDHVGLLTKLQLTLQNLFQDSTAYAMLSILGVTLDDDSLKNKYKNVSAIFAWLMQALTFVTFTVKLLESLNVNNAKNWNDLTQSVKDELFAIYGRNDEELKVFYSVWNTILYDYFESDILKSSTYNWLREKLVSLKFWAMQGSPDKSITTWISEFVGMEDYNEKVESINFVVTSALLWTPHIDDILSNCDRKIMTKTIARVKMSSADILSTGKNLIDKDFSSLKPILYPYEPSIMKSPRECLLIAHDRIIKIAAEYGFDPKDYLFGVYYYDHKQLPPNYTAYKTAMVDDRSDTILSENFIDGLSDNASIFAFVATLVLTKKIAKMPKWLGMNSARRSFWTARAMSLTRYGIVFAASQGVGLGFSDESLSDQQLKALAKELYEIKQSVVKFKGKTFIALKFLARGETDIPTLTLYTSNDGLTDDKKTKAELTNITAEDVSYMYDHDWVQALLNGGK